MTPRVCQCEFDEPGLSTSGKLPTIRSSRHRNRAQPPQPASATGSQARQPLQPRQPPQPRQATWTPAPAFSLSNRWNVARLTSAISSSPSVKAASVHSSASGVDVRRRHCRCGCAAHYRERQSGGSPMPVRRLWSSRFRLEACFTRGIVASSIHCKTCFESTPRQTRTLRHRVAHIMACASQNRGDCVYLLTSGSCS